jgi:hypothetical protein
VRYQPPGVALQAYLTPEILRIRSEMLQALQSLPGIERIKSREQLSWPFSRAQTLAAAREPVEALKAAFPKGILLGLANKLVLLEGVEIGSNLLIEATSTSKGPKRRNMSREKCRYFMHEIGHSSARTKFRQLFTSTHAIYKLVIHFDSPNPNLFMILAH